MPRGRKAQDFSGEIHGVWKVIERDWHPASKSHETFWLCECQQCGNRASVRKTDLMKDPRSCNNCKGLTIRQVFEENGRTKDPIHIGDTFGFLEVIGLADEEHRSHGYWKCRCKCGKELDVRVDHLLGRDRKGRTISCGCATLSSGELKIKTLLEENNIPFIPQYIIPDLSRFMPFDFAIVDAQQNVLKLIEFDGEQHFHEIEHFGGEEKFELQKERDQRRDAWCIEHNILLQRIPYWEYDTITVETLVRDTPYSKIKN